MAGQKRRPRVNKWITNIEDITDYVNSISEAINLGKFNEDMLPKEEKYPMF